MSVSHPHLLRLMAVDADPISNQCSMISEMMSNGNIKGYIKSYPGNVTKLRLVREFLNCISDIKSGSCSAT